MRRRGTLAPLLAAALAGAAAAASAPYLLREGRFSAMPPAGWSVSRDARVDARQKVYGARFSGPRGDGGASSSISIAYYAPGNALFKGGAAEFLRRNLGGGALPVAPAGETTSAVEKTVLGGLPARRFTRRTREYLPPDRTDGKAVAIVEEIEVADAKPGFYVLEFRAPEKLAAKLKPVYARVRAGLRFLPAD